MTTLPADQFNGKWIGSRFMVCELPTEFVWPNDKGERYNLQPKRAYGYCVSPDLIPFEVEKGKNFTRNHCFYAIEVWEDWGNDGHTQYSFANMFFVVRDDQVPENFVEYRELTGKLYEERQEERNRQYNLTKNLI